VKKYLSKQLSRASKPNEGMKKRKGETVHDSTAANERGSRKRGHNMGKEGKRVAVTPIRLGATARTAEDEAALNATNIWNMGRVRVR
jgi:hypothetical protein